VRKTFVLSATLMCPPAWTCDNLFHMELDGSIANNLASAVQSARRLRGHPVHQDTLNHWSDLLAHARRALASGSAERLRSLIIELENELADRTT
jgi:hypothetical protein